MRTFHASGGPGELLARTSFLEPVVRGRRVLELGAAAATGGASAHALAARGAASVVAADEDEDGVAIAARAHPHPAVEYVALSAGELPDGTFDVVVVHDGAPLAAAPERVAALAALLADGGRLVAALPVAGAPSLAALAGERPPDQLPAYESFVGSLEAVFPSVELATQSASIGWLVAAAPAAADEAPEPDLQPELQLDGAHGEPPLAAAYLAVCGAAPAGLAGMVLVTLPAAAALREAGARATLDVGAIQAQLAARRADEVRATARAEEAERRIEELEAELAELRAGAEARGEHERAREGELGSLRQRLVDGERALAAARDAEGDRARERDEARRESLARARELRAWADAQARVEQRLAEVEALALAQARDLELAQEETARAIAEAVETRARAEEARYDADAATARADAAEAELRRLAGDLEAGRREVERLRATLADARGRAAEGAQG
jgi:SAM-dependent methyltransferase